MIRVMQTQLHDPDKGIKGDCLRAALASVLEFPIDAVPHFGERHMNASNYMIHIQHWLHYYGLEIIQYDKPPLREDDRYYLVSGPSPRFKYTWHTCVWFRGAIFHDPHPEATGILEPREWELIKRVQRFED